MKKNTSNPTLVLIFLSFTLYFSTSLPILSSQFSSTPQFSPNFPTPPLQSNPNTPTPTPLPTTPTLSPLPPPPLLSTPQLLLQNPPSLPHGNMPSSIPKVQIPIIPQLSSQPIIHGMKQASFTMIESTPAGQVIVRGNAQDPLQNDQHATEKILSFAPKFNSQFPSPFQSQLDPFAPTEQSNNLKSLINSMMGAGRPHNNIKIKYHPNGMSSGELTVNVDKNTNAAETGNNAPVVSPVNNLADGEMIGSMIQPPPIQEYRPLIMPTTVQSQQNIRPLQMVGGFFSKLMSIMGENQQNLRQYN